MSKYSIFHLSNKVGAIEVQGLGLYTVFKGHCKMTPGRLFRLFAIYENSKINLGVLEPHNGEYRLYKKIPTKYLGNCEPVFEVIETLRDKKSIPLEKNEPFSAITSLPELCFRVDEETGLMVAVQR